MPQSPTVHLKKVPEYSFRRYRSSYLSESDWIAALSKGFSIFLASVSTTNCQKTISQV